MDLLVGPFFFFSGLLNRMPVNRHPDKSAYLRTEKRTAGAVVRHAVFSQKVAVQIRPCPLRSRCFYTIGKRILIVSTYSFIVSMIL